MDTLLTWICGTRVSLYLLLDTNIWKCLKTLLYHSELLSRHISSEICFCSAGQEEYDSMRLLSYPLTDIFLICYAVVSPDSYENVQYKWHKEVETHGAGAPYMLVGTKIDMRDDPAIIAELKSKNQSIKSKDDGEELKRRIGAVKYVECSALTQVERISVVLLVC